MRLKKVLTFSALSFALLVSASPAFASTSNADSNMSQKVITPQDELKTIHLKANTQKESIKCFGLFIKRCIKG
ncbi:hypothetical protein P9F86_05045 [Bacillus altitudinis]|uniref:hypothetical protein n=1 Tax=unclassified Bacillus (in: firmicutes) TaxID=185979 RepID=UPI000AB512DA|nr:MULTISPECIES: hypothetical protein [Bacillus]MCA0118420.1 hypothetical protein [Bacillus sp. RSS_NA_20]MEC2038215.1 hypothetical protein [Bacillus altitudinis]UTX10040.1 hypothetical protein NMH04_06140 [Bacillus altitudinis]